MKSNLTKVISLKILIVFSLGILSYSSFCQTQLYSVFSEKRELLGDLKVTRTKTDTTQRIDVVSQIKVTVLIKILVKYTLSTIYHNNELFSNSIVTFRNNDIYSVANTTKIGKQYRFVKDGIETIYSKKIFFSEALLYFHEPIAIASLYSEFDGVEKEVIKGDENHYKLKNPINGNISEYFYTSGVLTSAIVHSQKMTLHVVKQ